MTRYKIIFKKLNNEDLKYPYFYELQSLIFNNYDLHNVKKIHNTNFLFDNNMLFVFSKIYTNNDLLFFYISGNLNFDILFTNLKYNKNHKLLNLTLQYFSHEKIDTNIDDYSKTIFSVERCVVKYHGYNLKNIYLSPIEDDYYKYHALKNLINISGEKPEFFTKKYENLIFQNLSRKCGWSKEIYDKNKLNFKFELFSEPKRKLIRYKNSSTVLVAYDYDFRFVCNDDLIQTALQFGIGVDNRKGCGFIK